MKKREKAGDFLLPNARTYILAGDSAEIRIFLAQRRFGAWTEVAALNNPDARMREQDRVTDRPGRAFDSFGKGRHAMAPEETGRQHDIQRFAHDVAAFLNKGLSADDFDYLVVIADPTFLGALRKELSAALNKRVKLEMPINPTGYDAGKLKSLLT